MAGGGRALPARIERAALLGLVVLGAALRLATLGGDSLWFDEAATYHLVQGSVRDILAANAAGNSAPPLYPLLLGLVTGPDASEAMLRAPAAVAGIAAIPLVWLLAREFVVGYYALVPPLLVALSPVQIEYSQEVREYSLAFCTACLLLIASARFLRAPGPSSAVGVALAATASISVQYGNALLLLGANIVCLAAARQAAQPWSYVRLWLLAQLPAAAVGVLLLVTTLRPQLRHVAMGAGGYLYLLDRYWDGTATGLWSLLTADRADIVHFAYPGKLMFALTAAGALAGLIGGGSWQATALLVAPCAVTLAAALAGAYPFGGIRQDMFLTPMIYVCAALGLATLVRWLDVRLNRRAAAVAAAVAIAALAVSGATHSYALLRSPGTEPMRPIVAELVNRLDAGERIYVYWGALPAFRYYWRHRVEPWVPGAVHESGLDARRAAAQLRDVQRELIAMTADPAPFWVVISHVDEKDAVAMLQPLRRHAAISVVKGIAGSALLRVRPWHKQDPS